MFSALGWALDNLGIKFNKIYNSPRNAKFKNVFIFNPSFNIHTDKGKTAKVVTCTFILCVLHIVYQMKQFKINNGKFFIRILSNIFF